MFEHLAVVALPEADEALRASIKALIRSALGPRPLERRARSWTDFDRVFSRALGQAGFIGLTLPRKYGGGGRGHFARFVVAEELLAAGAPVGAHWITDRQIAPQILNYGTEAQRQFYLPPICRGEMFLCVGMSEPSTGSDLASVRTRALRTKCGWELNGSKLWTSHAPHADYMIALVRTSGGPGDRHEGLSQLIVGLKAPGVRIRPLTDLTGDVHFAEVVFEDVQLDADALLGKEGAGWAQVTAELAIERSGPERIYSSMMLLDAWITHLRKVGRLSEASMALAGGLIAQLATLRELSIAVTSRLALGGESSAVEAAAVKDLGTSFEQSIPRLIADDLGGRPDEAVDRDLYRTLLYLSHMAPSFSLRGGTREILRGIVARGLELR